MTHAPATLTDPGATLAALLLRGHTVLAATPAMTELLDLDLPLGRDAPPGLLDAPPGTPVSGLVVLHGARGKLHCRAVPVDAHDLTLLLPEQLLASTLLDPLPLDVAVLDARGRYLYVNPAAIRNPDVRRAIIGQTDREYVAQRGHPEERAENRERHFAQARDAGERVSFTETLLSPTGPVTVRRTYLPLLGADGELRLMIGYGEDQTQDRTLTEQMSLLRTMVDTSVDPLLVLDARPGEHHLRVVYGNPAMLDLLRHHGLEQLPDLPMPQWPMAEGNSVNILAMLRQLSTLPVGSTYRDTLFLPDAQQWLEVHVNGILSGETCTHWAISLRDVTAQRQGEVQQERVARAHRLALSGAPLGETLDVLLQDVDCWDVGWQVGLLIADTPHRTAGPLPDGVRRAVADLPPDLLEDHWKHLDPARTGQAQICPDLNRSAAPLHAPLRGAARALIEAPLYGRDGQLLGELIATHHAPHAWTATIAQTLRQLEPSTAMLLEQHLNQARLQRLAYRDPLTGLLSRAALSECAEAKLRAGDALALGLLDLDRFRFLNDGFGHVVGDQLLREVAARLRALAARHGLDTPARMGGDEFALLAAPSQIDAVGDDLRALFDEPFEVRGTPMLLEGSLGWSVAPATAHDAQTLLQQADAALYEAKRAQQFSQVYAPAPPARIPAVTMESALRESLRDGHFRLAYQPQVQLSSGQLVGAEALLRWTHPVLGPVTPDQFIPVAEQAGLMPRLGEWVLRAACHEAVRFSNPHLSVSVNVSSRQLSDPTFSARVRQALTDSSLCPQRLVLEVTESGLIDNPTRVREVLQDLRDLGVRVSMDDFGTGYSSLFSLRSLPVDELKIDRAFVRDLGQDTQAARESQAIVMASVLMARSLNIELLAEGVETPEQERALREAGCDLGQGWLYARALEPADFDAFEQVWPARLHAPRAAVHDAPILRE
ncbi:EAL domain-containing protein [Deinococcus sp. JMULE3]|uniref:sensor domain-containing protein n=1 Tax=Deinococcus sp. JMULE3 TaxID=2518341 RepID=UPI001575F0AE|nr:EAL domain-containing protein [Deinococcus sp. JMULE3]NTX98952.1 EAL domain-containing protein [Deinococcus sp. JMULE3]